MWKAFVPYTLHVDNSMPWIHNLSGWEFFHAHSDPAGSVLKTTGDLTFLCDHKTQQAALGPSLFVLILLALAKLLTHNV